MLREPGRGSNEVASARDNDALCAELSSQRIAYPLKPFGVPTGGDERRDVGVMENLERWVGLAGEPSAVSTTHTTRHGLR
jgi:hypothetical protein